jgi:ATP-binding protein involved in chromosome partitioning
LLEQYRGIRDAIVGTGGGQLVADALTSVLGTPVPLLGETPMDRQLREGGDTGRLVVLTALTVSARSLDSLPALTNRPALGSTVQ